MKKVFTSILISLILSSAFAQNITSSAKAIALGDIGQTYSSPWNAIHNQAMLANLNGFNFAVFYRNYLALPGLSDKAFCFSYTPAKNKTIALSYLVSGIKNFNLQKAGLAYGMKLAEKFFAGLAINLNIFRQPDYYGNLYSASGEISLAYYLTPKFLIASHFSNFWYPLANSKLLPINFQIASGYQLNPKTFFTAEIEKNLLNKTNYPLKIKWGAQFIPVKNIQLRIGGYLFNNYYTFTFGLGFKYKISILNIGFESNPLIGFSSAFDLNINID